MTPCLRKATKPTSQEEKTAPESEPKDYFLFESRRRIKSAIPKTKLTTLMLGKEMTGMGTGPIRKVVIHSMNPQIRTKSLIVKGQAFGTKLYPLTLVFYHLDYSVEQDMEHPLYVSTERGGTPYFMAQIKEEDAFAQARCNCLDYYFTWAWWNHKTHNLAGPPFRKYVRKTTWWPPRNPTQTPGLCKHLMSLVKRLKHDRIII